MNIEVYERHLKLRSEHYLYSTYKELQEDGWRFEDTPFTPNITIITPDGDEIGQWSMKELDDWLWGAYDARRHLPKKQGLWRFLDGEPLRW